MCSVYVYCLAGPEVEETSRVANHPLSIIYNDRYDESLNRIINNTENRKCLGKSLYYFIGYTIQIGS